MEQTYVVSDYVKNIFIGHDPQEHTAVQEVVFHIEVRMVPDLRLLLDTWEPLYDYCAITRAVDQSCSAALKILQEPLAWAVLHTIFEDSAAVEHVFVRIEKTQRYANTRSIGFRLAMSRTEWETARYVLEDNTQSRI